MVSAFDTYPPHTENANVHSHCHNDCYQGGMGKVTITL